MLGHRYCVSMLKAFHLGRVLGLINLLRVRLVINVRFGLLHGLFSYQIARAILANLLASFHLLRRSVGNQRSHSCQSCNNRDLNFHEPYPFWAVSPASNGFSHSEP